jgi:hypothetical protein
MLALGLFSTTYSSKVQDKNAGFEEVAPKARLDSTTLGPSESRGPPSGGAGKAQLLAIANAERLRINELTKVRIVLFNGDICCTNFFLKPWHHAQNYTFKIPFWNSIAGRIP